MCRRLQKYIFTLLITLLNPLFHEFYFTAIFNSILRLALIVYRLIDAALLGNLFHDPFLLQNLSLGQMSLVDAAMKQRVNKKYVNLNLKLLFR